MRNTVGGRWGLTPSRNLVEEHRQAAEHRPPHPRGATFPEALPPAPTLGGMSSQHFSAVCGSQGKPSAMEHRTGMGKEPPAPRC